MAFHFLFFPTMTIIRDSWTGAVEFHASFFLISVFMFAWHCWNKKNKETKAKRVQKFSSFVDKFFPC